MATTSPKQLSLGSSIFSHDVKVRGVSKCARAKASSSCSRRSDILCHTTLTRGFPPCAVNVTWAFDAALLDVVRVPNGNFKTLNIPTWKKRNQNKIPEVKRDFFASCFFHRVKKQNSSTIFLLIFSCPISFQNHRSRQLKPLFTQSIIKGNGCLSIFHIQPSIFNNLHSSRHQNNGESTLSHHTPWKCCSNWLGSWIRRGLRHLQHFGLSPLISNWRQKNDGIFQHVPKTKCEKKHQNPPEPPATFGEITCIFPDPFAFPSPASLAARSHSAIRVAVVFVVLGPSQRRGRTTERKPPCRKSRAIRGAAPAASYSTSPLPARARAAVWESEKSVQS